MSTPEASSTRQRSAKMVDTAEDSKVDNTDNPASLSANPNKKVPRNKPIMNHRFADMSMNRFLTYMVLGLLAVVAFYLWRFTVRAASVGGYWALISGHHHKATGSGVADIASSISASAASSSSTPARGGSGKPAKSGDDVQSQIYNLANALGIKPAELSAAIRPLIDPSAPNPADVAKLEAEVLKQQVAASQAEANNAESEGGSLLGMMGEALLD